MDVMVGKSIDCTEDFLIKRNADCISEERRSSVQSMLMQGRGHFMNTPD